MKHISDQLVLEIAGLSIAGGSLGPGKLLVQGVDLTVRRGEIVGLVGESGSGKSLTALSIAGLLPAKLRIHSGRIVFEGRDISHLPESRLHALRGKTIGYVFQDPLSALNPTLSIGTQLIDVLKRHIGGVRAHLRREAAEALHAVGITRPEERLRAYPHELSGGMRQRVLIAMAMLPRPKLLIADEPTTALDVTVQVRIIELLRGIRKTGVSILFISHNLDLVLEFCERVTVMYGGRIMESGSAHEVANLPRHPYTRALLDCVPRLGGRYNRFPVIGGQPPSNLGDYVGCPFAPRCERVQERCHLSIPPLERTTESHSVACWNPTSPAERTS